MRCRENEPVAVSFYFGKVSFRLRIIVGNLRGRGSPVYFGILHDPPVSRGRLALVGKRATKAPASSAGVNCSGTHGRGDSSKREALSVVRRHQPEPREWQDGQTGWRVGSQYRGGRVTSAEGRILGLRAMRKKGGRRGHW